MSSNQWKRYFFTLLTINIVVIVVILSLLFWPVSNKKITKKDFPSKAEYAQFMIQTDKEQLNELINGYLEDILADKQDRKSTRLNSSHVAISYAVFCLKKKKNK